MDTIDINEIFGPTLQGEGSAAGQHCLFVRLAHCNLECKWCDTPYTWAFTQQKVDKLDTPLHPRHPFDKAEQIHPMPWYDVVTELRTKWDVAKQPTNIVISGGEPLMQGLRLYPLVDQLWVWGNCIHIETAGTILPPSNLHGRVTQYNVSPKLAHSGNLMSRAIKPEVLEFFARQFNAWFKFVVQSVNDFDEIDQLVEAFNIDRRRVMIMPEGTSATVNIATGRAIVDATTSRGYGLSMRTHILLWGDERGR